ncbi:MAG TPA: NUDIX hydrolase [Acidimicrobiaceae bacterium]|nr:NUDIX hydrolase [Acidimicrobiaceae bacterium]
MSGLRLNAAITVDLVVLTVRGDQLQVLLVRRGAAPFKGRWALPGGFVEEREDLATAAARELREETGVAPGGAHLEQLATYGAPGRDPRGRVVSTAYLAFLPDMPQPVAGSDAAAASWVEVEALLGASPTRLAFDHTQILRDGVERARSKLEYTSLAAAFCRPEFTVAELRRIYEAVWGTPLDPRNFHRKVTSAERFIEPVGATTRRVGGRPAQLFRVGGATLLTPPLLRPDRG